MSITLKEVKDAFFYIGDWPIEFFDKFRNYYKASALGNSYEEWRNTMVLLFFLQILSLF